MDWLALLLIGLLCIISSLIIAISRYRLYKNGKRIIGKIIEVKEEEEAIVNSFNDVSFTKIYKAVIEFVTDEGEKITFVSEDVGGKDTFNTGDDITVVYDSEKRKGIYLDRKIEFFRLPLCIFIIGILFISFSFTLYLL